MALYLLFPTKQAFSQDQIVKSNEAQFGSSLDLRPYKIYFKRDNKQYSVDLPFKVSEQVAQKLLSLADTKKPRTYIDEMEVEDLYQQHITGGNRDKYFDGSVKQWGQLKESDQENFKKNIMPKMKEYFAPLEDITFYSVMEMLINNSNSTKKDCNCIDLNGVQIKSCE